MTPADPFREAFDKVAPQYAAATVASQNAADYVSQIESEIDRLQELLASVVDNEKSIDFAKGDAAEMWHEGTANIDAARQGLDPTALALRESVLDGADVTIGDSSDEISAQLKYYGDAASTARAIGTPGYDGMQRVVPADQVDGAREWLLDRADQMHVRDRVESERLRSAGGGISDRIIDDSISSHPLTEDESRSLVNVGRDPSTFDPDALGIAPHQVIEVPDFLRQGGEAGIEGAGAGIGVAVAALAVAALKRAIDEGTITLEDLDELSRSHRDSAARSALTGTLAGVLTIAADSGLMGDLAQSMAPEAISAVVVMAVRSAALATQAANGQRPWESVGYEMAKTATVIAGAFSGAAVGTAIFPVVGTIVGSLVGAALVRTVAAGGETILVREAVHGGYTFFGMVEQDYSVPVSVWGKLGWETVDFETASYEDSKIERASFELAKWEGPELEGGLRMLGRGLIGVRRVGYV